jgi:hypothetical protein
LGSRVRIPSPAPNKAPRNQYQDSCFGDDIPASICLNEPRTAPNFLAGLGKRRAKRSCKVLRGLQRRGIALAAAEREAPSKGKSSQADTTKGASKSQTCERHFFWVTHSQINVGFVAQAGDDFTARDASGRKIGVFESLKTAADAVSDHCGGAL